MDVVFCYQGIGGSQIKQVIISGFCALQLVFRVLGLSLRREREKTEEASIPDLDKSPYTITQLLCSSYDA